LKWITAVLKVETDIITSITASLIGQAVQSNVYLEHTWTISLVNWKYKFSCFIVLSFQPNLFWIICIRESDWLLFINFSAISTLYLVVKKLKYFYFLHCRYKHLILCRGRKHIVRFGQGNSPRHMKTFSYENQYTRFVYF
jgi:hypothetical protein